MDTRNYKTEATLAPHNFGGESYSRLGLSGYNFFQNVNFADVECNVKKVKAVQKLS